MNIAKTVVSTSDVTSRMVKMGILALNSEAYSIIERKLNEAFQEIVDIATDTTTANDRLYAMNIQFVPITRLPGEEQ